MLHKGKSLHINVQLESYIPIGCTSGVLLLLGLWGGIKPSAVGATHWRGWIVDRLVSQRWAAHARPLRTRDTLL